MSKQELENLAGIGKLKAEPGTRAEFDGLVDSYASALPMRVTRIFPSRADLIWRTTPRTHSRSLHCVAMIIAREIDIWSFKRSHIRWVWMR